MKDFLTKALFLPILVFSVAGCTIALTCEMFNASGHEIKLTRKGLNGNATTQIVPIGSSVRMDYWARSNVTISGRDFEWVFSPGDPGVEFVKTIGFGPWATRLIKVQLDESGRIFVLKPNQSFPAIEFPAQPDGFPLLPIGSKRGPIP
jgi:hypothetical protein